MSLAQTARHLCAADAWLERQLALGGQTPLRGPAPDEGEEPWPGVSAPNGDEQPRPRASAPERAAGDREDFAGLLRDLEAAGERRAALLRSLTPEQLERPIRDERFGGEVSAWWVIVRGNLDHEIHHRGQIATALRQIERERERGAPGSTALHGIDNCILHPGGLATAGQPSAAQFHAIAAAGYEVVINLLHPDSSVYMSGERDLVGALGMRYVHIPVDWTHPRMADLRAFCAAMEAAAGQAVFVHCAKNMRVSVFVALYRFHRLGWAWERARAGIHRIWEPDPVWESFIDLALEESP